MKRKIIAFCVGEILHNNKGSIDVSEIEGFVDNNSEFWGKKLWGKEILNPKDILSKNFDMIVIFSGKNFNMIYNQLVYEMQISEWRVIDYRTYIYRLQKKGTYMFYNDMLELLNTLRSYKYNAILDIDMLIAKTGFFHKADKQLFADSDIRLDAYVQTKERSFPIYNNLYDHSYNHNDFLRYKYDAVLFAEKIVGSNWEKYKNLLIRWGKHARYIIVKIPFPYTKEERMIFSLPFDQFGHLQIIRLKFSYLLIIDQEYRNSLIDLKIYVATHKKYSIPNEKIYVPIHAGKINGESYGYIGDDTGDNISTLNPYINECTALYWIWKNSDAKYIGLNHYRRYFLKNSINSIDNILDSESVKTILDRYDIILPEEFSFYPDTVGNSVKWDTDEHLYEKAYQIIRSLIETKQKKYLKAFDYVMSGHVFYRANMFITRKEISDKYCEWIFSFLIDAVHNLDVNRYSRHNQRMIGFLAERMFTVWLLEQNFKIKEMPIIELL